MLRALRNLGRLIRIALTSRALQRVVSFRSWLPAPAPLWFANRLPARRGAGRPGQRLAGRIQELGPTFIKLGQASPIRADSSAKRSPPTYRSCRTSCRPFRPRRRARPSRPSWSGRWKRCSEASTTDPSPPRRSHKSTSPSPLKARRWRSRSCGPGIEAAVRARSRLVPVARRVDRERMRRGCAGCGRSRSVDTLAHSDAARDGPAARGGGRRRSSRRTVAGR